MFDIGAQEILVIAIVAILVIGPKDMPAALRVAGRWVGKLRRISGQFRSGLDSMIREAEMEDMEKKWKAQNEKIMRQYPEGGPTEMEPTGALPAPASAKSPASVSAPSPADDPGPEASSAEARAPAVEQTGEPVGDQAGNDAKKAD